jgi:hypothetical protein
MKEILIILSSTWKFAATFPVAVMIMKMSFIETLIFTNLGGILGVIIFVFISKLIIKAWNKYFFSRRKISAENAGESNNKKTFTKKNKRIIILKKKYGLPGIVILNPVILSIPVSAFLISKYYGKKFRNYCWLIVGQLTWSLVYTYFYTFLYDKWNLAF